MRKRLWRKPEKGKTEMRANVLTNIQPVTPVDVKKLGPISLAQSIFPLDYRKNTEKARTVKEIYYKDSYNFCHSGSWLDNLVGRVSKYRPQDQPKKVWLGYFPRLQTCMSQHDGFGGDAINAW